MQSDINSFLNGKSDSDFKTICNKLVTSSYDGTSKINIMEKNSNKNTNFSQLKVIINVPMVNAFVIAVPWLIYAKYHNDKNELNQQRFLDSRNESYGLFAVI